MWDIVVDALFFLAYYIFALMFFFTGEVLRYVVTLGRRRFRSDMDWDEMTWIHWVWVDLSTWIGVGCWILVGVVIWYVASR